MLQGAGSNLSGAGGGIGRGGTPVVGGFQGTGAASPAPFSGFGPESASRMTNAPGTGILWSCTLQSNHC